MCRSSIVCPFSMVSGIGVGSGVCMDRSESFNRFKQMPGSHRPLSLPSGAVGPPSRKKVGRHVGSPKPQALRAPPRPRRRRRRPRAVPGSRGRPPPGPPGRWERANRARVAGPFLDPKTPAQEAQPIDSALTKQRKGRASTQQNIGRQAKAAPRSRERSPGSCADRIVRRSFK